MGVGGFCPCCPCRTKEYVDDGGTIETIKISKIKNFNPKKETVFEPNSQDDDKISTSFEREFEKLNNY